MDLTVVANTALNKLDRRLPEILIGAGIASSYGSSMGL